VVNAADGAGFNGGMTSSPFVHGELLITGNRALKKDSGALVWDLNPAEACQWASPALYSWDGRESVLCFNTRGLTCVNLADGSKEWNYPLTSDSCSAGADPVLYGDQILLSTRPLRRGDPATMLLQITEAGPKVAWSRADVVSNFQERVVWKDHVFGCDAHRHTKGDATLKCVSLKTGEVTWSEPNYDWGQLIASDGKLLVIRHGELSIIDANPQKFRLLSRASVVRNVERWAGAANAVGTTAVAPVLANRRIYCRGATGDLVCLDVTPQR
jgi:outer membrane protein assembly factor BamB